ncbi:hypothetical protein B0J13DRAFT_223992 [Dactylonectria estremocensis]|uniref:Uncharacterized protein n=1 Tax=Dactylonectria estremocensis TaxID=1079267 RepID=A0A9P9F5W6_9HYPO|nr:hypothetical protein B0J13DRAFT_223992 [Dactylonectria estremocensis]
MTMASLRISIPINAQTETDRQDFVIRIHSIAGWRKFLEYRPQRKTRAQSCSPNNSPGGTQHCRQLAVVDRQQGVGKKQDVFPVPKSSESNDKSGPHDVANASRWSHSTVSTNVGQLNDHSPQDEEVLKTRMETLQILEGSNRPTPDRDYPRVYARNFERFKEQEVDQREFERMRQGRHSYLELKRLLRASPWGWSFLRSIIVKSLEHKAALSLPPYYNGQQVFLLTIKKLNDGREMVADARNLNTCSNADLVKRMAEVEKRGWRDVLWVSNQKQEFPKMVKIDNTKELDWGHLSMI